MTTIDTPKSTTKNAVVRFVLRRMSEPSTWRGGIMILTAAGVVVDPDASEKIVAFGLAVAGLVGMFFPDSAE